MRLVALGDTSLERGEKLRRVYSMPLGEPRKPLATWLQRRGMKTIAVVDDGASQFLSLGLGMAEGFDSYLHVDDLPVHERDDRGVTKLAIRQIEHAAPLLPFFLWVHYYGPHQPNTRHPDGPASGDSETDLYDNEIAFLDRQLGRLLASIEEQRAHRELAVLLTADHGEHIAAHWRGHGVNLDEGSIRIPLFVSLPHEAPGRSEVVASLVDVMPTILALTRTPAPAHLDGADLVALSHDQPVVARTMLADLWRFDADGSVVTDRIAVFDGSHKLVLDRANQASTFRSQPGDENDHPEDSVDVEHLTAAADRYLEQNRRVDFTR